MPINSKIATKAKRLKHSLIFFKLLIYLVLEINSLFKVKFKLSWVNILVFSLSRKVNMKISAFSMCRDNAVDFIVTIKVNVKKVRN